MSCLNFHIWKFIFSYAVLAVEMGGHAVKKIHEENALNIKEKGQTDVGKAELLTKADLVSNHLMLELLQRFPGMTVSLLVLISDLQV